MDNTTSRIFNHELKLRVISALVLAAIVLGITWIGGYTFTLLWAAIAFAMFFEYSRICKPLLPGYMALAGYAALFLVIGTWITGNHQIAYWMAAVFAAVLLIWEFLNRKSAWSSVGFLYAAIPFFAFSALRSETEFGLFLIFILFACVWGADVFAYFFGKSIGGPKLAPRLSPKKTWAGFLGSLVGASVLSVGICWLFGYPITVSFMVLILFLAIVSQIGDLLESMLKRTFDVKDSGSLIPGHGGVLDRIDGLVVAGSGLWLILGLIQYQGSATDTFQSVFTNAFLMP